MLRKLSVPAVSQPRRQHHVLPLPVIPASSVVQLLILILAKEESALTLHLDLLAILPYAQYPTPKLHPKRRFRSREPVIR